MKNMNFYLNTNRCVLFILVLAYQLSLAQETDFGTWLDASAIKKYALANVTFYSELLTNNNNNSIDRLGLGVGVSKEITHSLELGIAYLFMNKNKTVEYEQRHRFYSQTQLSKEIEKIKFSLRERLQVTSYPKNDLTECNYIAYWRNRLKISYLIAGSRFSPLIGVETFFRLNKTSSERLDEVRYNLSTLCSLSNTSNIELYALLSRMTDFEQFVMGISYQITI